ncbi:MAG: heavy metal translocating P-type ATPase [Lachnospiraceae bacterium]|nr:heavy metal translocating P-type ATPase [Lachnospiraceae bacterium]
MKQYNVTGMSCAACVNRVESAVLKVPGVSKCSVSLLTNSMGVEGEAGDKEIIEAVKKAGYGASAKDGNKSDGLKNVSGAEVDLEDKETPVLIKRLVASAILVLVLMYFSMGHPMLGFPVPKLINENMVALGLLELILAVAVMVINQKFFISGFKSALHLAPNMDTLIALGSSVSFAYSVVTLFAMISAQSGQGIEAAGKYMNGLFFESAAMILVFISIGKTLEAKSKGKTTDALKSLMKLAPKTATLIKDGKEEEVSVEQVAVNDIFVVKPGENIPVDGIIIEGTGAVNEASLTGESIPVDKSSGDEVSAATINMSGYIKCRATRVGKDTTLSQIIEMVSDAAATKAPIAKTADRVAGIFVPAVLIVALITFTIWLICGESVGGALTYATAVLVISCPCSLGLATPVAIMVGNGMGAKNGILFKTSAALEGAGRIQIVAMDKTGTITKGEPEVTDIVSADGITESRLLELAYALEAKSEHPLAKAIVRKALEDNILLLETTNLEVIPGKGLRANMGDDPIFGGNEKYIAGFADIPAEIKEKSNILSKAGKTPLYFARDNRFFGMIAVADVIKEDAKQTISELKNMGIEVTMITGDNENTANAIAAQAGVDRVFSGVLPGGKEIVIRELKKHGKVAMVGDGINDAPALTRADIGIAIGSGTDVAIDSADVVLMKNKLSNVSAAIRLGRATLKNVKENLFWAFFYNSVGIPIAAGVFSKAFGLRLNPMIGALAMSLSSVCVVTNALRLNLINIYDAKRDKIKRIERKEDKTMTKTLKIEGMMCPRCEAHVKSALEGIDGVSEAVVSHVDGTAVVTLSGEVSDKALKEAVEAEKYDVIGIE